MCRVFVYQSLLLNYVIRKKAIFYIPYAHSYYVYRIYYWYQVVFSAAVHEESVLGSDSEQIEVSPSTSDQVPGDLAPLSNGVYIPVPNVKPRHKPNTDRKWSEVSKLAYRLNFFFLSTTFRCQVNKYKILKGTRA